ncbi:MAG: tetratricopeptide repeat protein, partial [Chitinophagaceae bacterium]
MKCWFCISLYITVMVITTGLLACKQTVSPGNDSNSISRQEGQRIADSILSLSPERQMLALLKWYNILVKKDSQPSIAKLNAAEQVFKEKNNTVLRRQAWLLQYLHKTERNPTSAESAALMLHAAEEAASKKWWITQAECWHFAGHIYFKGGLFVPAFEYLRKAQNVFDKNARGEYAYLLRYAGSLALCYYQFGEYRQALQYIKQELQLPSFWGELFYFPDLSNTIGLCYQQLKQYDSAAIWYQQSHDGAAIYKDTFYMALANGNLGYSYYLQQQYDKALPLLLADYAASINARETGSAINAAFSLADIYIKKGQLGEAEKYVDITREHTFSTRSLALLKNWYENLYHLSLANGDYKRSSIYADSLIFYKDSLNQVRDKKAFNQEVLKLETEKHLHEVTQLESRRKQQVLMRNSLLAGLVLLMIIALLAVNRQLLKRNKERELSQQQLEFAGHELQSYMQQLKEKNELLEQLREDIAQENNSMERTGDINRLVSATILTEEDWKKFRQLFEKVYPGFFVRLREKMPDLSATDTRLLALTKLQVTPKD